MGSALMEFICAALSREFKLSCAYLRWRRVSRMTAALITNINNGAMLFEQASFDPANGGASNTQKNSNLMQ
jgi:hypothetical protein